MVRVGDKMYSDNGAIFRITNFNRESLKVMDVEDGCRNVSKASMFDLGFKSIKPHCWFRIFLINSKDNTKELVCSMFVGSTKYRDFRIKLEATFINKKHIWMNDNFHSPNMYENTMTRSSVVIGSKLEFSCYMDDNEYTLKKLLMNSKFGIYLKYIEDYCKNVDINRILKVFIDKMDNLYSIISMDTNLDKNLITSIPSKELKEKLEYLEGYKFKHVIIVPYWYDIRMNMIKNDYVLIRDIKTRELFVVNYSKGEPIIEPEAMTEFEIHQFLRY